MLAELACGALLAVPCLQPVPAALSAPALDSAHVMAAAPVEPATPAADAWLGSDKFRHAGMSWAATAFAFAGARAAGADGDDALRIAIPVAAVLGVGKEVHDRRQGGIFSLRDIVADAVGIAAAFFLLREVR